MNNREMIEVAKNRGFVIAEVGGEVQRVVLVYWPMKEIKRNTGEKFKRKARVMFYNGGLYTIDCDSVKEICVD